MFVPDQKGKTIAVQLNERNDDMYDYEQEIEPILQVLVGKSLEAARYELLLEEEFRLIAHEKQ